jgi:ribonuclease R
VNSLAEAAAQLGFSTVGIEPGMPVKRMAELLRAAEDTPAHDVLHTIALRSMSKARYSETPVGHYGLALEDYAHFTSPIRRYPDLTIHRILTEFLPPAQKSPEQLQRKYQKFVKDSALQSSETELRAMNAERRCSDCYKAEYMKDHVGEQFEGVVSSVASYGIYVALPNTVEGLIHHSRLPGNGEYQMLNAFLMKNMQTGKEYRIGDCILVRCSAVDVSAGKVDFEAIEPDAE